MSLTCFEAYDTKPVARLYVDVRDASALLAGRVDSLRTNMT
jgi:hypothetical protein